MTVKINGSLNLDRLAKALERIHEEQSGERVSISIRKMTDDERLEYQSKFLGVKVGIVHDLHT